MTLLLTAVSALATVYMALQLYSLRRNYARELLVSRVLRTLDAIQLSPSVTATINRVLAARGDGTARPPLAPDTFSQEDLIVTLNSLEALANGIAAGVYDEDVAYSSLGLNIPSFYYAVEPLLYELRSKRASVNLFIEFEHLARRWQDRDRGKYSYASRERELSL
jgi:hypothetical protein